ncbi:MAG: transmembrane anchor protein, partial [Rhodospirillaceae bacterium]|nr:transmembrane anchor protein [Rhodospirillaceae bacterium]
MYNKNIPSNLDIPSTGKLIKSTVLAAITAGALLVTVVLPAEYGIDPTGIGNAIGLKKMGEIKVSL